jgi:predicted glycosyltransferase
MSALVSLPSTGRVRKLLLYSHDTFGLGHIRRNLGIAEHVLERDPQAQIVLVSGSAVSDRFRLPRGADLVLLPPVVKVGPDAYRPRDPRLTLDGVRRMRTAIIARVIRRVRPNAMLVDHSPTGMDGELLDVFEMLRATKLRTRLVLGLRDVLDDADTVTRTWSRQGIYELLERVYDEIYVYGQRDVFDLESQYGINPRLARRLRYCGYLDKPSAAPSELPRFRGPFLLATAGGGGDGAEVLSAALEAGDRLGLQTLVVTGPLMEARQRAALDARAASTQGARVMSFHPGLGSVMRAASAIVTMGGYNSMCEAVAAGTPTVVVPRTWPRREQAIRAELFADRGLVHVVSPGPELGHRLAPVIRALVHGAPRPSGRLDMRGLDRLADGLLHQGVMSEPLPVGVELAA